MSYTLGINGSLHDSSLVALHIDTPELDYFFTEDRHSGIPHHYGFPIASAEKLKKIINLKSISSIALSRDIKEFLCPPLNYFAEYEESLREPMQLLLNDMLSLSKFVTDRQIIDLKRDEINCLINSLNLKNGDRKLYFKKKLCYLVNQVLIELNLIKKTNEVFEGIPIIGVNHHQCHASLALNSSLNECAVITWDGRGEFDTTTLWKMNRFKSNKIEPMRKIKHPFSLGSFYNLFVEYCGFNRESGPGKLMGLSAYGSPVFDDIFRNMINVSMDFDIKFNTDLIHVSDVEPLSLTSYTKEVIGPPSSLWREERLQNIAFSAQKALEKAAAELLNAAKSITNSNHVFFSGGVALNCVMNGKLFPLTSNYDIFPASGDDGTALGAALSIANTKKIKNDISKVNKNIRFSITDVNNYNNKFSDQEISKILNSFKLNYRFFKIEEVADLILSDHVIGILKDSYEIGPRALGQRSILGNAFSSKTWPRINSEIKFREDFRPFAPMVINDDLKSFFGINSRYATNSMLSALEVSKHLRSNVPAIVHKNGKARVQVINKEQDFYYSLLKSIKKKRGLGICVNTSLNMSGESMIETPDRLIEFFAITSLDGIVIGPFIVERSSNEKILNKIKSLLGHPSDYLKKRKNAYTKRFSMSGKPKMLFESTFEQLFAPDSDQNKLR